MRHPITPKWLPERDLQMTNTFSRGLTRRSVLLGLALIPLNCFWIIQFEFNRWSFPTYLVPYYNVIFCLVLLTGASATLKRMSPRWQLQPGELLIIYLMMCIASCICSHNMMEILVTSIGHGFWFATPENEWRESILPHLPSWLTISDKTSLKGYYEGDTTLYRWGHLLPWLKPFIWWLLFTMALLWVMLCINVILRRQWMERERLTYPIIQLPLAIINPEHHLLRNRAMWFGLALTGGATVINGLNVLYSCWQGWPGNNSCLDRISNISAVLRQEVGVT